MNLLVGVSIVLILSGMSVTASALQDPYPLYGYVLDSAGATIPCANVAFTNQNTNETIYDDTSASGWYINDALNFPSGWHDGDVIQYTTTYILNTSEGGHNMNITLNVTLDSDTDGIPDAWDAEPDTPAGYLTDAQGRGRLLGDMNGDGKLTSVDALMILQMAVR